MSCIFGETRDIFFPKLSEKLDLITFSSIAERFLKLKGFDAYPCKDENEARESVMVCKEKNQWPCYFTVSDTTGEKSYEEFYMPDETIDLDRFEKLGIVKNEPLFNNEKLNHFISSIDAFKKDKSWSKGQIVELFREMLPELEYEDKGKYLDSKM
jgi:FlaA1/EpsC-like NDP-sugar epimerase